MHGTGVVAESLHLIHKSETESSPGMAWAFATSKSISRDTLPPSPHLLILPKTVPPTLGGHSHLNHHSDVCGTLRLTLGNFFTLPTLCFEIESSTGAIVCWFG